MFNLSENNIHLSAKAKNKKQAIGLVAHALQLSGCVKSNYANAMMERENQISTFLENGIAIPHGSLDSRALVMNTGVEIFQFPEGVEWGDGNIAYIVIGIAANSDKHLPLLSNIFHLLKDENKVKQLISEKDIHRFKSVLLNEKLTFSAITLDIDTESLLTLVAVNADKLYRKNAVNSQFISEILSNSALPLGNGIWITDSTTGNKKNAFAFSRAKKGFIHNGKFIRGVVTISVIDEQVNPLLSLLLDQNIQQTLLSSTKEEIESTLLYELQENLRGSHVLLDIDGKIVEKEFIIRNQYGLHTRPATILVNIIKKYNASVFVQNLSRNSEFINAKSPIKIVSLSVLKGHKVKFVAKGEQAQEVIDEIEVAIFSNLGE